MLPTLSGLGATKKRFRRRLGRLKGMGSEIELPPVPDLDSGPERVINLVDDTLQQLTRELEDERLAKRVLKLKKKYPGGTYPELVVMDWLERKKLYYEFQVSVLGGRLLRGGQVLDFVVDNGPWVLVLEVQGNYWHTRLGKRGVDAAQRLALMGLRIWGKPVRAVVEVWESRIMDRRRRNQALELALSGIELGQ